MRAGGCGANTCITGRILPDNDRIAKQRMAAPEDEKKGLERPISF
jgi:hypothetical protein